MKLASIKPGDIVRCDRLGRVFWARVSARENHALAIMPVTRNISYHSASGREVLEHYAHRPHASGKVSTRSIRCEDLVAYKKDGASVLARVLTRKRARLRVLPIAADASARDLLTRQVTDHYSRRKRARS